MRSVYSIIAYLLTPLVLLRLWWKGRYLPAYRERIPERFCWDTTVPTRYDVWIHAVSLGEVIAAIPLVDALLEKKLRLLITTTTPTGAEKVKSYFSDKVTHRYVPYDLPSVVKRFYRKTQPRVGVIMETELWPNLITEAANFHIPLLLVNARLSERSCRGYKKISWLIKPTVNQFHKILAQNAGDAEHFKLIGADSHRVEVCGNIKFDIKTKDVPREKYEQLQALWGKDRVAVMLASTHDDEEQQILAQLPRLQQSIPGMVLLIAPRHPERFQSVYLLAKQMGFATGLRSQEDTLTPENEVVVLDSIGELLGFYQVSHYAFIGGSLVPVGGHNVLEPIAMRVPVFSGPLVHNFKAIIQDLVENQAIEIVDNGEDLINKIIVLHQNPEKKNQLIENASHILDSNKGALIRYVTKIEELLS